MHHSLNRCFFICFLILMSCGTKSQQEATSLNNTDTTDIVAVDAEENTEENVEEYSETDIEEHDIIDYSGPDNKMKTMAESFQPLTQLSLLASSFIYKKDSLRSAGDAVFKAQEEKVYAAILEYKRAMESGKLTADHAPGLLDLQRSVGVSDSSFNTLPDPGGPSFFNDGRFFFVGGAPFFQKIVNYDTVTNQEVVFTDAEGKPELHFQNTESENVRYFFRSMMSLKKPKVSITFGKPVSTYDGPPDEVRGIGSIIHHFEENVEVFFLTAHGAVPARLKYYDAALTENSPCYASFPRLVFACSENVEASDIMAVYIPYDGRNVTSCVVSRESKWLWTADINGDNIPDIACAIGTYEGVGIALEMLWFINVNGEWKIIDYAAEPSCT